MDEFLEAYMASETDETCYDLDDEEALTLLEEEQATGDELKELHPAMVAYKAAWDRKRAMRKAREFRPRFPQPGSGSGFRRKPWGQQGRPRFGTRAGARFAAETAEEEEAMCEPTELPEDEEKAMFTRPTGQRSGTSSSSGYQGQRRSIDEIRKNIVCRGCGVKGHFERECPKKTNGQAASGHFAWAYQFMNTVFQWVMPAVDECEESSIYDDMPPLQYISRTEFASIFVAILDSGCTMTCAGQKWIDKFIQNAKERLGDAFHYEKIPCRVKFRFGNGSTEVSHWEYVLPVGLGEDVPIGSLEVQAIAGESSPLLSRKAHQSLKLKVDYEDDTVYSGALGSYIPTLNSSTGHQLIQLDAYPSTTHSTQGVALKVGEEQPPEAVQPTQTSENAGAGNSGSSSDPAPTTPTQEAEADYQDALDTQHYRVELEDLPDEHKREILRQVDRYGFSPQDIRGILRSENMLGNVDLLEILDAPPISWDTNRYEISGNRLTLVQHDKGFNDAFVSVRHEPTTAHHHLLLKP